MTLLTSNDELYRYLVQLGELLAERGASAEGVRSAVKQAAGLSIEFLGESRNALMQVLNVDARALKSNEREQLLSVISQIEAALQRKPA
jgi:hypothetical protein